MDVCNKINICLVFQSLECLWCFQQAAQRRKRSAPLSSAEADVSLNGKREEKEGGKGEEKGGSARQLPFSSGVDSERMFQELC